MHSVLKLTVPQWWLRCPLGWATARTYTHSALNTSLFTSHASQKHATSVQDTNLGVNCHKYHGRATSWRKNGTCFMKPDSIAGIHHKQTGHQSPFPSIRSALQRRPVHWSTCRSTIIPSAHVLLSITDTCTCPVTKFTNNTGTPSATHRTWPAVTFLQLASLTFPLVSNCAFKCHRSLQEPSMLFKLRFMFTRSHAWRTAYWQNYRLVPL
jgi:hypothetical protein